MVLPFLHTLPSLPPTYPYIVYSTAFLLMENPSVKRTRALKSGRIQATHALALVTVSGRVIHGDNSISQVENIRSLLKKFLMLGTREAKASFISDLFVISRPLVSKY